MAARYVAAMSRHSRCDIHIACAYIPCPSRLPRFVVIYSHPNGSDISDHLIGVPSLLDFARFYKCDVYTYDYSGYGISSGCPGERQMYADIDAVYEYVVNEKKVKPSELVLLGYSIGSAAAIDLAVRVEPKPAGIILQAPPTSILRVLTWGRMCFGNTHERESCCADRFRTLDKIGSIKIPVLLIHGTNDQIVPKEHSEAICQQMITRVAPEWVPAASHDNLENCKEVWLRIRQFVKKFLCPFGPEPRRGSSRVNAAAGFRQNCSQGLYFDAGALLSHSVSIDNYTTQDCEIAYHATTNPLMQTIRFVHVFFCVVGATASALFIFVLLSSSSRHMHVNLRISLASLSFAACIACIQLLLIAVYHLVNTLADQNPCDSIYEAQRCAILRFPVVLSIYATLCGIIVLAIERTIATLKYRTYEAKGSRVVAASLVVAQWSICTVLAVVSVLLRSDPGYVHYCTAYVSHPRTAVFSLCFMSLLEIFTLIYFVLLLHSNQRRQVNEFVNKAMHTLTERYQLQENVKIMRILIPSITVHAVLGVFGLGSMLVFAVAHRSVEERLIVRFAPFSEVVLLVIPVYAVVFPFVAVVRNKQLRQATRKALPFLFNPQNDAQQPMIIRPPDHSVIVSRPSKQMERDSDTHFDLLNEMWKK
ncbi:unnamed protein product [Caenorhabditis auriculariae]|uniref:G-protein coupled receptors family 1 profile domain-containing protein n=1 Tax=Caenorhabditis auriculariae TaxID=2777116 RepID=A0A8S1HX80_9PELO|nr:unnamed protein product [Caenorhabditis auriculariae]